MTKPEDVFNRKKTTEDTILVICGLFVTIILGFLWFNNITIR